ncbi:MULTISPECIES: ABC transporter permease subunit [unclassified Inquilinus]|uniref:ABC transporter permease subunit n=1 Tax=unclassified Inquilinus TaxID=2645927 RepID=UPI003F8E29DA
MLLWSDRSRAAAWALTALIIGVLYVAPLAVIVMASFAGQWNGVLPSLPTLGHYAEAVQGSSGDQIVASLVTGAVASLVALAAGTWAALALRSLSGRLRRVLELVFFLPSAVPSVSVGLGVLVAYSQPPVLLNGTVVIVLVVHLVLISAFAFGNVSAGLSRLAPEFEQVAESLGARPGFRLRHVTLPLLMPYLLAAFSLSIALSMGELGATVMVYPPGWVTLPVGIFALTDRGDIFQGSALTVLLILETLAVLGAVSLVPKKAAGR